jgi:D-lactate dehydrogenase
MKVAFFSTHRFEKPFFVNRSAAFHQEISFFEATLNQLTASLADGFGCVCCFVDDQLDSSTPRRLSR